MSKIFLEKKIKNIFSKQSTTFSEIFFSGKYIFFNGRTKCSEKALKKDKFCDLKESLFTKSFANFSNFQPDKLACAIYQLIPDNFTSHYHEYIGDLHHM